MVNLHQSFSNLEFVTKLLTSMDILGEANINGKDKRGVLNKETYPP